MKKLTLPLLKLVIFTCLFQATYLNAEDSSGLYIAKVISDFAGKEIQQACGELKDGEYEFAGSAKCQKKIIQIKLKIKPSLHDCSLNLLPLDVCDVIINVDEALDNIKSERKKNHTWFSFAG